MELFPFISRCSHDAIVAAKQEQIAVLQEEIAYLRASLEKTQDAGEKRVAQVMDALKPVQPEMKRRRRSEEDTTYPNPETLDLSMVDPSDNEALVLLARREIPPGVRMTAPAMMRKIEKLREEVIEAHKAKTEKLREPVFVPASITEKIAAAEHAGKEMAGVGA